MHKWWPIYLREWHLRHKAQFEVLKALCGEVESIDNETPTWSAVSYINIALKEKGIPFRYLEIQQPGKYFIEVQQTTSGVGQNKEFEEWCKDFEEFATARDNWQITAGKK